MERKIRLAILMDQAMYLRAFRAEDLEFLASFAEVVNPPVYPDKMSGEYMKAHIGAAEAVFTCWGTPPLTGEILNCAPELRVILHGAGTPKAVVSEEVWRRGIRVATAAPVIAADVAETALGAMICMRKRFHRFERIVANGWAAHAGELEAQKPEMYRLNYLTTVGIIGASHVGRHMMALLRPFGVKLLLYDPCVSEGEAAELGVELVPLDALMARADIVSCHAPKIPATDDLIGREQFARMRNGAMFVNTSRGSCVDQHALFEELKTGRICAYLDVYEEEPLPADSELIGLENVLLTPHISGGHTVNGGYERGAYIIRQLHDYCMKGSLRFETRPDMLRTMA